MRDLKKTPPEQGMVDVCVKLVAAGDAIALRQGAASEPVRLREDEPDPVAPLAAGANLGERPLKDAARLCAHEALDVKTCCHAPPLPFVR